jgi:phosphoribosyl 1,2-cyclic phosphodiesterase
MLSLSILASGSSGNCTLVCCEGAARRRNFLIDAGLSPRQTQARLESLGLGVEMVSDILLTHLDADHLARGWGPICAELGITVHVHRRHCQAAIRAGVDPRDLHTFETGFDLGPRTSVHGMLLAHDRLGSIAYRIEHASRCLGFATDLGRVTRTLLTPFAALHALALESNYDRSLQLRSSRPEFLKQRIMSGLGHLSNEQALDAVLAIDRRSTLEHVVLLHLSRECNSPELVRHLWARRAPHLLNRLVITSAERPTPLLEVGAVAAPQTLWG